MTKALATVINIGSVPVKQDKDGMISITDLFHAAQAEGLAEGKRNPSDWAREAGSEIIEVVAKTLNTHRSGIIKATRGRHGGTYAHKNIALAYAKYLSPRLHMAVNDVYLRAASGDVTLAAEISDKAPQAARLWLAHRVASTVARNEFTSTLCEHGVTGKGYADSTNAIYSVLLGGERKAICISKGVPATTNLRNIMNIEELCRTQLAEIVAAKNIKGLEARGNKECTAICHISARKVAAVQ